MGEADWKAFHAASGLEDWRVTFSGPGAWFRTASLAEGVALISAIAALDGVSEHPPSIDLRADGVGVRLTRDLSEIAAHHVELARSISVVARDLGIESGPARVQHVQVAVASPVVAEVIPFWEAVLGYEKLGDEDLLDPHGRGPSFWFQQLDPDRPLRHAMHIDVAVPRDQGEARIAAALAAGGRIADDSHAPEWWTLADPVGNKVDIAIWPDQPGAA